ncbi:MAG: asparaginase [Ignavibacteria bacterium]|jgi:L-asparaginase
MKPKIAVFFTGGTICMRVDEGFGGIVPALSAKQILDTIPDIDELAEVEVIEFGHYPGPHMSPEIMFDLSNQIKSYVQRDDIHGIIVTHGTDTLEETAYFLDCTVNTEKPIIVIGAMRNSSEPDWDGPRNLRDALILAGSPDARGYGVLLCLSDSINAASEATKTDTNQLNTFASFDFGPIGRIVNGTVMMYRKPVRRESFHVTQIPKHVPLLKCYAGMDAMLITCALEHGAKGLVIEAFGVGNVPPSVFYALKEAVQSGIPIVLTSRCPVGRIEHIYAYEGAGKHLYDAGIIFADYLNGQKARIKLIAALGAGYDIDRIRAAFEWA